MTNMIQVCSQLHWAQVFIINLRPDEIRPELCWHSCRLIAGEDSSRVSSRARRAAVLPSDAPLLSLTKCFQSRLAEIDYPTNPSRCLLLSLTCRISWQICVGMTLAKQPHKHFLWDTSGWKFGQILNPQSCGERLNHQPSSPMTNFLTPEL